MSRKAIAIVVILVWVAGLGLISRRDKNRTLDEKLAEVGLRVSPDAFYYTLQQNGNVVGVASSTIDTSNTRVVVTDLVRGKFPTGKDTMRVETRTEARFTRGMRLRDLLIAASGDISPVTIRGVMQEGEDKTLRLTTEAKGERPVTQEHAASRPIFLPTSVALPLMLKGAPKIGDSIVVSLFDPLSRTLKDVAVKVQADSLFLVADSAILDSATHRWVKAHQDSVRGWRITGRNSSLTAWVDAAGRLIAGSEPGGVSMMRTAFELSFANWKIDETKK